MVLVRRSTLNTRSRLLDSSSLQVIPFACEYEALIQDGSVFVRFLLIDAQNGAWMKESSYQPRSPSIRPANPPPHHGFSTELHSSVSGFCSPSLQGALFLPSLWI